MTIYNEENLHPPAGDWSDGDVEQVTFHEVTLSPGVGLTDIVVGVYHGVEDGKPVIQIDTSDNTDLRVNINDAPIWNSSVDSGAFDVIQEAALSWLNEIQENILPNMGAWDKEDAEAFRVTASKLEAALGELK